VIDLLDHYGLDREDFDELMEFHERLAERNEEYGDVGSYEKAVPSSTKAKFTRL
jgi:hypothetical protein